MLQHACRVACPKCLSLGNLCLRACTCCSTHVGLAASSSTTAGSPLEASDREELPAIPECMRIRIACIRIHLCSRTIEFAETNLTQNHSLRRVPRCENNIAIAYVGTSLRDSCESPPTLGLESTTSLTIPRITLTDRRVCYGSFSLPIPVRQVISRTTIQCRWLARRPQEKN
jgi:hypothetical protein